PRRGAGSRIGLQKFRSRLSPARARRTRDRDSAPPGEFRPDGEGGPPAGRPRTRVRPAALPATHSASVPRPYGALRPPFHQNSIPQRKTTPDPRGPHGLIEAGLGIEQSAVARLGIARQLLRLAIFHDASLVDDEHSGKVERFGHIVSNT